MKNIELNYMPSYGNNYIKTIRDAMALLVNVTYKEYNNILITDREIAESYGVIINDINWFYSSCTNNDLILDLIQKQFSFTNTSMTSIMIREVFSDNYIYYIDKIKRFIGDIKKRHTTKYRKLLKEINIMAFNRFCNVQFDFDYYDTVGTYKKLDAFYMDLVVDGKIDDTLNYIGDILSM